MKNLRLNFGKHKGQHLSNTPNDYQNWLNRQDWFKDYIKKCHKILNQLPKELTKAIYSLEEKYKDYGDYYFTDLKTLNLINRYYDDYVFNWKLNTETTTQDIWVDVFWEILHNQNENKSTTTQMNSRYGVDGWTKK